MPDCIGAAEMGGGLSLLATDYGATIGQVFERLGEMSALERTLIAFSLGEYDEPTSEGDGAVQEIDVTSQEDFDEKVSQLVSLDNSTFKMVSGDCASLTSLQKLETVAQTLLASEEQTRLSGLPVGLAIPNNMGITDEVMTGLCEATDFKLSYLNVGGSGVKSLFSLTGSKGFDDADISLAEGDDKVAKITRFWANGLKTRVCSLIVLDVSYTPLLDFEVSAPFATTPFIRRLVLDGGNIKSTIVGTAEGKGGTELASLFFGLLSLVDLSMAECQLESVEALTGLSWFKAANVPMRRLNLSDNPLRQGTAALSKEVDAKIKEMLPSSLAEIDGVAITTEGVSAEQNAAVASLAVGRIDNNNVAVGFTPGGGDLDAADKEFTAALKGEQDNTVVA